MNLPSSERIACRRIVTGFDDAGRSTVIMDGPPPLQMRAPHPGATYAEIWETDRAPASNAGIVGATAPRLRGDDLPLFHPGGTRMFVVRYPGREELVERGITAREPTMHTTNAVDCVVVLKGELVLHLETGETPLAPGDCVIVRGSSHDIHNYGPDEAMLVAFMIDALPLASTDGPTERPGA